MSDTDLSESEINGDIIIQNSKDNTSAENMKIHINAINSEFISEGIDLFLSETQFLSSIISGVLSKLLMCQTVPLCKYCITHSGDYMCCSFVSDLNFDDVSCNHEEHVKELYSTDDLRDVLEKILIIPEIEDTLESGLMLFQKSGIYDFEIPDVLSFISLNKEIIIELTIEIFEKTSNARYYSEPKNKYEQFMGDVIQLALCFDCECDFTYVN